MAVLGFSRGLLTSLFLCFLSLPLLPLPLSYGVSPRQQDEALLRRSLERKNFLNQQDSDGNSALHLAITLNRVEDAKRLINVGANISLKNRMGSTPLHLAAFYDQVDIVNLLIKKGARVNVADNEGFTPLHFAALYGNLHSGLALIKARADVNALNARGWTPLHLATLKADPSVVSALLDAGANPNTVNHYGRSPLRTAMNTRNINVIRLLKTYGAKLEPDLSSTTARSSRRLRGTDAGKKETVPPIGHKEGSSASEHSSAVPSAVSSSGGSSAVIRNKPAYDPRRDARYIARDAQRGKASGFESSYSPPSNPPAIRISTVPANSHSSAAPTRPNSADSNPNTGSKPNAGDFAGSIDSDSGYVNIDPWRDARYIARDAGKDSVPSAVPSINANKQVDSATSSAHLRKAEKPSPSSGAIPSSPATLPSPSVAKNKSGGYGRYIASVAGWKSTNSSKSSKPSVVASVSKDQVSPKTEPVATVVAKPQVSGSTKASEGKHSLDSKHTEPKEPEEVSTWSVSFTVVRKTKRN